MSGPRRTRRAAALTTTLLSFTVLAACGGDDDTADEEPAAADTAAPAADTTTAPPDTAAAPADTTTAPADTAAGGAAASAEFCDAFTGIDQSMANAPEDPAEIGAFVEQEIAPKIATIRANLPDQVAGEVSTMVDTVETATTTGDFSLFESPEFGAAGGVVYSFLEEGCGLPTVTALARDFTFGGVPAELEAGLTVFVMTNDSEAGEAHEMAIAKIKDGDDISVEELLSLPEPEAAAHLESFAGMFAPPGATTGTSVELTPGRWLYACFIPVGSVDGQEGDGMPHFMEGMQGEFTVV